MGRDGSPLRERVIFVEGAPRSGTTWLVTLLATHPEIAGVEAESHLFDFGLDRLFDNLEGRDPVFRGLQRYVDRDEFLDLARDFCDGVLMAMRSHVSNGSTPPFVVEKTPIAGRDDAFDLERKREVYPDAWYVHIVRDREAVIRSLMRAPWMPDRSYAACAAHWDRTVGRARETLGDLPHYREVSYEELRADPGDACRELFEWLGVASDDDVLETVRVLSREQFSELGAVPPAAGGGRAGRVRPLLSRARARLERRSAPEQNHTTASALAFYFVQAMHERDAETLRSITAPSLEFVYRSADGDLTLREEEARAALVMVAEDTFARRYVGEWWAAPAGGPGEWWTSAPGKAVATIFFSALAGDATRVDFAIALQEADGLVKRAVMISAGPLAGRPVLQRVAEAVS
jgi:sulfotransferase family protein